MSIGVLEYEERMPGVALLRAVSYLFPPMSHINEIIRAIPAL